jgi:hypothetical protein
MWLWLIICIHMKFHQVGSTTCYFTCYNYTHLHVHGVIDAPCPLLLEEQAAAAVAVVLVLIGAPLPAAAAAAAAAAVAGAARVATVVHDGCYDAVQVRAPLRLVPGMEGRADRLHVGDHNLDGRWCAGLGYQSIADGDSAQQQG